MTNPSSDPVDSTEQFGPDFQAPVIEVDIASTPRKIRQLPRGARAGSSTKEKDSPPKSTRSRRRESTSDGPAVEPPPYEPGRIAGALKETYGKIGVMVGMFDPFIGETCVRNAEQMANSMERLAKESPRTRAFLDKIITSSAVGEAIAAHSPLAMAIGMRFIPALRNRANQMAAQQAGSGMNGQADTSGSQTAV